MPELDGANGLHATRPLQPVVSVHGHGHRGTYWCTSRVEKAKEGQYSVSVGVAFDSVKWFRGRETANRTQSNCPDEQCCRRASDELTRKWEASAWPEGATPTSLLAALPTGTFPGVDSHEVYDFLEMHERGAGL